MESTDLPKKPLIIHTSRRRRSQQGTRAAEGLGTFYKT